MKLEQIEKFEISDKEYKRLSKISKHKCPNCLGPMMIGDEEAGFICGDCYWDAVENTNA